jgi:hypothetical protein
VRVAARRRLALLFRDRPLSMDRFFVYKPVRLTSRPSSVPFRWRHRCERCPSSTSPGGAAVADPVIHSTLGKADAETLTRTSPLPRKREMNGIDGLHDVDELLNGTASVVLTLNRGTDPISPAPRSRPPQISRIAAA